MNINSTLLHTNITSNLCGRDQYDYHVIAIRLLSSLFWKQKLAASPTTPLAYLRRRRKFMFHHVASSLLFVSLSETITTITPSILSTNMLYKAKTLGRNGRYIQKGGPIENRSTFDLPIPWASFDRLYLSSDNLSFHIPSLLPTYHTLLSSHSLTYYPPHRNRHRLL